MRDIYVFTIDRPEKYTLLLNSPLQSASDVPTEAVTGVVVTAAGVPVSRHGEWNVARFTVQ